MSSEPIIILLFIIASAVAVGARRWNFPYTVALVLVGLGLGSLNLLQAPELTHDLLFLVFLPGLIFEAAYHIDFDELWRDKVPILGLAIPGVVAAIGLTAVLLVVVSSGASLLPHSILPPVDWPLALIFGAAVAATDPIAVIAIFRHLGAPHRLNLLTEGESLLNDGTSIVLFGLLLAWVMGNEATVSSLIVDFGRVVGGGLITGGIVGIFVSLALRQIDEPLVEIMLTSVAAYGSFLVADQLGFSGVISTVVSGLICGNYGARVGMSPSTRLAVNAFWEYVGFALNSLIFLLMALEIDLRSLIETWPFIVLAYVAVVLARTAIVYATTGALFWSRLKIPLAWAAILSWGGIRGALSMVLVLSLPADLEQRSLIINMVFGVVLLSILIQGTTISWLGEKLGVLGRNQTLIDYETARTRIRLAHGALDEIEKVNQSDFYDESVLSALKAHYEAQLSEAFNALKNIQINKELRNQEDTTQLMRRLLQHERT
ncbi:MAG: cation:proton antiporter [Thiotrichales bacterium]